MTAGYFLAHLEAGLTLSGQEGKELIWMGTDAQWRTFEHIITFID